MFCVCALRSELAIQWGYFVRRHVWRVYKVYSTYALIHRCGEYSIETPKLQKFCKQNTTLLECWLSRSIEYAVICRNACCRFSADMLCAVWPTHCPQTWISAQHFNRNLHLPGSVSHPLVCVRRANCVQSGHIIRYRLHVNRWYGRRENHLG